MPAGRRRRAGRALLAWVQMTGLPVRRNRRVGWAQLDIVGMEALPTGVGSATRQT